MEAATVRADVALGAREDAGVLGFSVALHLGCHHHHAGHGRKGHAAHHALGGVGALATLGKVGDAQHGAITCCGQIHQRLQGAAHLGVFVAVASNSTHHRVDHQQLDAADLLYGGQQLAQVAGGVERHHLAIAPRTLDEKALRPVSPCRQQARQKGIGGVILTAPYQHVACRAGRSIGPAPAYGDGGGHAQRQGGFALARSARQDVQLAQGQPVLPQPAHG